MVFQKVLRYSVAYGSLPLYRLMRGGVQWRLQCPHSWRSRPSWTQTAHRHLRYAGILGLHLLLAALSNHIHYKSHTDENEKSYAYDLKVRKKQSREELLLAQHTFIIQYHWSDRVGSEHVKTDWKINLGRTAEIYCDGAIQQFAPSC